MAKRKPAAVMGALVNMKNISTHKSVALTIHIPAEAAQEVLAAFGWPTMVDPVPVAVARLEESASLTQRLPNDLRQGVAGWNEASAEANRRQKLNPSLPGVGEELPPQDVPDPYSPAPARLRHWAEMSPAQQTGVIRNERNFWDFAAVASTDEARDYIRWFCGVKSCADIVPGTETAAKWAQLQVRYGNWLRKWGRAA